MPASPQQWGVAVGSLITACLYMVLVVQNVVVTISVTLGVVLFALCMGVLCKLMGSPSVSVPRLFFWRLRVGRLAEVSVLSWLGTLLLWFHVSPLDELALTLFVGGSMQDSSGAVHSIVVVAFGVVTTGGAVMFSCIGQLFDLLYHQVRHERRLMNRNVLFYLSASLIGVGVGIMGYFPNTSLLYWWGPLPAILGGLFGMAFIMLGSKQQLRDQWEEQKRVPLS